MGSSGRPSIHQLTDALKGFSIGSVPVSEAQAPIELGLAASLGLNEVPVRRPLRVALFSTGDELRSIGETLGAGEIYERNRKRIS